MKKLYLSAGIFLTFLSVEAQVAKDSMPVAKPSLTDTAMLRKPVSGGDNMPVANPDEIKGTENTGSKDIPVEKMPAPYQRKRKK